MAVEKILDALETAEFRVAKIDTKPQRRHPAPPFITSSLQMEANRKLRFPPKKTMSLAQKLYEGKDLGDEGPVGLITYMRSDSTRVSARGPGRGADLHRRDLRRPSISPPPPTASKAPRGPRRPTRPSGPPG